MQTNYHDIPALNASGINAFYRSPLHFWKQSTFNPERVKSESTPAMVMGSLAHCLALEPETFSDQFVVAPAVDRRTKAGKEAWEAFQLESNGKQVVTQEQYEQAKLLQDALFKEEAVRKLLGNGCSEQPVTWQREEGGLLCKAKLDYLRSGLVIDYKTTEDASPEAFSKSIAKYGYHRQMAWYLEAARSLGEKPRGAVFIVQEKATPEAIGIYALDGDSLLVGGRECDAAYDEITKRLTSNEWEAYITNKQEPIRTITLPGWYKEEGKYDESTSSY